MKNLEKQIEELKETNKNLLREISEGEEKEDSERVQELTESLRQEKIVSQELEEKLSLLQKEKNELTENFENLKQTNESSQTTLRNTEEQLENLKTQLAEKGEINSKEHQQLISLQEQFNQIQNEFKNKQQENQVFLQFDSNFKNLLFHFLKKKIKKKKGFRKKIE